MNNNKYKLLLMIYIVMYFNKTTKVIKMYKMFCKIVNIIFVCLSEIKYSIQSSILLSILLKIYV